MSIRPILIIDASAYLFRAYHIVNTSTSDGRKSNVIVGTLNLIQSIVNKLAPCYVAVVFDPPGGSFRNEIFPDYKATRKDIDLDFKVQITPTQEIIANLGYKTIIIPGYEADDVIGTLARKFASAETPVYIASGDKDFVQLVDNHIIIYDEVRKKVLNIDNADLRLGIPHSYTVDFLALQGDSSDNIPGAKGIGEKTAQLLINNLGGINDIYQKLDQIKSIPNLRGAAGVRKKLEESKANVELSYLLATIKDDLPIEIELNDLKPQIINSEKAINLMEKWELNTRIRQVQTGNLGFKGFSLEDTQQALTNIQQSIDQTTLSNEQTKNSSEELNSRETKQTIFDNKYQLLDNSTRLQLILQSIDHNNLVFIYPEFINNQLPAVAIAIVKGQEVQNYLILLHKHDDLFFPSELQAQPQLVFDFLSELISNPFFTVICFELKRLAHAIKLDSSLMDIRNFANNHDVQILAYATDSNLTTDFDKLIQTQLKLDTLKFEGSYTEIARNKLFSTLNDEKKGEIIISRLTALRLLWNKLIQNKNAVDYYNQIERDLWIVLYTMESTGINIDTEILYKLSEQFGNEITDIEQQAYQVAGKEFNLNSPKQIKEIIFDQLNLGTKQQQNKGSTSVDVLETISHPLTSLILEHRSLSKLKSTYTDALNNLVDEQGLIHTTYEQKAVTGRLTSNNPNLQNIPIRTDRGRKIRQAFIAPKNKKLYAIDYSQIELRVIASISDETTMINSFAQDLDIHQATAADIFHTPLHQVTSQQRRFAKSINFGLIYGMGAHGLAQSLGISRTEAQKYIDDYFNRFPNIKEYMESTIAEANLKGYITTMFGRHIYIQPNSKANAANDRFAINAPIQGTAAEIIKLSMYEIYKLIRDIEGIDLLLQVHDELVFAVAPEQEHLITKIVSTMEQAVQLKVKLKVEYNSGNNWDQAH